MAVDQDKRSAELLVRAEKLRVPTGSEIGGKVIETGSALKISLADLEKSKHAVLVCVQTGEEASLHVGLAVVHKEVKDSSKQPMVFDAFGEVDSAPDRLIGQAALRRGEAVICLGSCAGKLLQGEKALRFVEAHEKLTKAGLGIIIGTDTGGNLVVAFDDTTAGNSWGKMLVTIVPEDSLWDPPFSVTSIHSSSLKHWEGLSKIKT